MNTIFDEFYKKIQADPSVVMRNIRIILKLITNTSRNNDQRLKLLNSVLQTNPKDDLFTNDIEIMESFAYLNYEKFYERFISDGKIHKNIDHILNIIARSEISDEIKLKLLDAVRESDHIKEISKYIDIMHLFLENNPSSFFELVNEIDISKNIGIFTHMIYEFERDIDNYKNSIEYKVHDIERNKTNYKNDTDKKRLLHNLAEYEKEIAEYNRKIDQCEQNIFKISKKIDVYIENFELFTNTHAFRYYIRVHSQNIVDNLSIYLDSVALMEENKKLEKIKNLFELFIDVLYYESEFNIDVKIIDDCIERIMQMKLPVNYLKGIEDYNIDMLFKCNCINSAKYADKLAICGNINVYETIIQKKEFANTPIVKTIIDSAIIENDENLLRLIASQEHLVHLKSFQNLFNVESEQVLETLAKNPSAKQCNGFKRFFDIDAMFKETKLNDKRISVPKYSRVMKIIAEDPQNPLLFDEYRNLFYSERWFIMDIVMRNPNAVRFENEYRKYMVEYKQAAASNPNASKFPEYSEFYSAKLNSNADIFLNNINGKPTKEDIKRYEEIKEMDEIWKKDFFELVALSPRGYSDPKYKNIFYQDCNDFTDIFNINAIGYKEFNDLVIKLYEKKSIHYFPYILYFPAYKKWLEDKLEYDKSTYQWRIGIYDVSQSPIIARDFPNIFKQYFKFAKNFSDLFQNPYIYLYPKHVMRALCDDRLKIYDLRKLAKNKYACLIEDAYRTLFKKNELIKYIAENPNAVQFGEFANIFRHKESDVWKNLAKNPNAPVLFRDQFRKIFKREELKARIEEISNRILVDDNTILGNLAKNPNAVQFKEFRDIISNKNNYKISETLLSNTSVPLYYPNECKSLIYQAFDDNDEYAMGIMAGNPNIALVFGKEIDILMQEKLKEEKSDRVIKFITRFASGSYFANMKSFRQLFKERIVDVDIRLAYNDGATTLPEFIPFMNDIINQVNMGVKRHSYVWHRDENESVLAAFSENLTLPLVYPQKFKELLYMKQYHVRSNAFNNPNAFNIIYPEVLKHDRKIMINKNSRPIFIERSWKMHDQNYGYE